MRAARQYWYTASRHHARHTLNYSTAPQRDLNAILNHASHTQDESALSNGGPLSRKTIAVKDNIVTSSTPTTAGSNILSGHVSPFEATVIQLLRQNGATIVSKTNLDEFGMGSHSQNSHHGPVLSPFSRGGVALSPGGSSGGSAAAVATGQSWAALGTDTGGSVRLPAAYTGIVGFKPSYGLLSRWGVIQYANSLDTVGVLTRCVEDARELFRILNQHDARDPTSLPPLVRSRIAHGDQARSRPLRIGIPIDYIIRELSPAVRAAYCAILTALQNQGHILQPVSLPTTRQALSAYYVLAPAEASSNLAKYDGIRYGYRADGADASPKAGLPLYAKTRGQGFGEEVKRRILLGAYTLSSEAIDNYFIQAQKVRRLVQRDFDRVFAAANPLLDTDEGTENTERVDVLLTPTAPTLPPTVAEVKKQTPVESYMNDVFTVPASLAGLPAISVAGKLPDYVAEQLDDGDVKVAGMQIIGQFGDDERVLEAAKIVEELP